MDVDNTLKKILDTAKFPVEKHQEFINTFYQYLLAQSLKAIQETDESTAQRLADLMQKQDIDSEEVKKEWQDLLKNDKVKEKLDAVTNQVLGELADDISSSATEEEKQQILASFSTST